MFGANGRVIFTLLNLTEMLRGGDTKPGCTTFTNAHTVPSEFPKTEKIDWFVTYTAGTDSLTTTMTM